MVPTQVKPRFAATTCGFLDGHKVTLKLTRDPNMAMDDVRKHHEIHTASPTGFQSDLIKGVIVQGIIQIIQKQVQIDLKTYVPCASQRHMSIVFACIC